MGNSSVAQKPIQNSKCPKTGSKGIPIANRLLYFKVLGKYHNLINADEQYRFCDDSDCDVVYFDSLGNVILKKHLREQVGIKEFGKSEDFPVCHCFNFSKSDIERDIEANGATSIPTTISLYIKQELCLCEIENPSGQCCLGFVNGVVKHIKESKK